MDSVSLELVTLATSDLFTELHSVLTVLVSVSTVLVSVSTVLVVDFPCSAVFTVSTSFKDTAWAESISVIENITPITNYKILFPITTITYFHARSIQFIHANTVFISQNNYDLSKQSPCDPYHP